MIILTVDFLLGGLFLNIFPDQILGGPMLASGLGVVVFAGIEKIFPFKIQTIQTDNGTEFTYK